MRPLEDYKTDMPKRSPVMTMWILLRLKNAMLLANMISNLIGVAVIYLMTGTSGRVLTEEMERWVRTADMVFLPIAFLIPLLITVRYERPIRGYWEKVYLGLPPDQGDTLEARKRLLNEPFFLIGLDFAVWVTAGAFYTALFWNMGAAGRSRSPQDGPSARRACVRSPGAESAMQVSS